MAHFEIGNVVQLKSGGPPMTVHAIGDYSQSRSLNPGVACVWFDGSKKLEDVFHPETIAIWE